MIWQDIVDCVRNVSFIWPYRFLSFLRRFYESNILAGWCRRIDWRWWFGHVSLPGSVQCEDLFGSCASTADEGAGIPRCIGDATQSTALHHNLARLRTRKEATGEYAHASDFLSENLCWLWRDYRPSCQQPVPTELDKRSQCRDIWQSMKASTSTVQLQGGT